MKKIYKLKGMDCPSCAALLESDLEDLGVDAKCSFAKCTLEVDSGEDWENKEKDVIETIQKSGFSIE